MKTIDLKRYYPNPELYEESNMVDVSDEVANVMEQSLHDEKSAYMRSYRAKAYYSLDYGNGVENYVVFHEETPEEIYERKMTIQQLNKSLSRLPIKQGQHIYAYYFLGKTCKEIAVAEHISTRAVQKSLKCGLKKLGKLLKNSRIFLSAAR